MLKALVSFIGAILLAYFCYREWTNRTLYWGRASNDAVKVLQWIQTAQIIHKKTHGTYTDSLQELVLIPKSAGSESSGPRDKIENQLRSDPGLLGLYYYSIRNANGSDFLAEARLQRFTHTGEDIWQISSRGDVIHSVSSQLASRPFGIRISSYVMILLFIASLVFYNSAKRRRILKKRDAKITSKLPKSKSPD
jgi:hypothetical protein